ncbi:MAG: phosphotransferase [Chloroflexi bacterium]|nr:phosphotransferase [Chloroflexota bacterium]
MPQTLPPLISALLQPDAYPFEAGNITLHETHISWVLLAGPYAFKLHKPVDFGFVDFTSRAARYADCAAEVRLNRRLCPDVYLGVVPVEHRDGRYRVTLAELDPSGLAEPLDRHAVLAPGAEPAVWMRRLPADGMLPAMLARDAVPTALVERIATMLAAFHERAETGPGVDEYGTVATIKANWDENFRQVMPFVGRTILPEVFGETARCVRRLLTVQRPLFERRVAEGRIRDCHGDLHAGSVCVADGQVYLFDCLEFLPRFRCSDVAAEVAFLAMDLDHYGRRDLANAFVRAYVSASRDPELLALLDFYRCYRAFVRGKVDSLRLADVALPEPEQQSVVADARAYFDLALGYVRQAAMQAA